jgi:RNA polymerase sigma-70 factor (ECF subfamily)
MKDSRPEPDNIVIQRFLRLNNQEDFRTLVTRHVPAIRGLLYSIFKGNLEDVEDAEQEILLSLFTNLGKFRFRSSFRTFLFRFARNKAIDMLRRTKREKIKIEALQSLHENEVEQDPIGGMIDNQNKKLLFRALGSLPEDQRSLIVMKETGQCSVEDCARVFGIPVGTVKSRLHSIRRKLYLIIKEEMR